jgi:chemotaxis protein MotB
MRNGPFAGQLILSVPEFDIIKYSVITKKKCKMKKTIICSFGVLIFLSSCVSQKKYGELLTKSKDMENLLNTATLKLNLCLEDKQMLSEENSFLKSSNQDLIQTIGNITILTAKGAHNLEKTLESLGEKDLTIGRLQDAISRRDSINFSLVKSLKGVLGDFNDEDIEINVDKGVVFVSLSDKLLFKSGSYIVSNRAKEILGKIAKVVNNKPDFEFMVEGHTDNVPYAKGSLVDNWDLSVKRATSVVRILQNTYGVDPSRMTAAGRSEYVPISNEKSRNRRTRIIVLPKIDQFYKMIDYGM